MPRPPAPLSLLRSHPPPPVGPAVPSPTLTLPRSLPPSWPPLLPSLPPSLPTRSIFFPALLQVRRNPFYPSSESNPPRQHCWKWQRGTALPSPSSPSWVAPPRSPARPPSRLVVQLLGHLSNSIHMVVCTACALCNNKCTRRLNTRGKRQRRQQAQQAPPKHG